MTEQLANNIIGTSVTLSSGINSSVTSLTVSALIDMPSSGNFRIRIENELLLVTAVSTLTLTVTRGIEGTTAASHSSGVTVSHVFTKGSLEAHISDYNITDTFSNLPSAGSNGRLFLPTDSPYLLRDNGSSWDYFGPFFQHYPLSLSGFSWINQAGASITTTNGVVNLSYSGSSGGENVHAYVKTAPSTPYIIDVKLSLFMGTLASNLYSNGGFVWRDSSSGKLLSFSIESYTFENLSGNYYPGYRLASFVYTNETTYSGTTNFRSSCPYYYTSYMRIADDGTNHKFSVSGDGINFFQVLSVSRTANLTNPNQVGFYVNPYTTSAQVNLLIHSWKEH